MNIEQALNVNVSKIKDIKQLREIAHVTFSAMNKRIARIEKSGKTETPAYRGLKKQMKSDEPRFSTKGRDIEQLQREIIQAQTFAKSKTGSLSNIKSFEKDFFKKRLGLEEVPKDTSEFWSKYRRIHNQAKFQKGQESDIALQQYALMYESGVDVETEEAFEDLVNQTDMLMGFYNVED